MPTGHTDPDLGKMAGPSTRPTPVDAEYARRWRSVILPPEVFAQFRLMILTAGVGLEGVRDPSQ